MKKIKYDFFVLSFMNITFIPIESGELFTWGHGSDGQLGIGSITSHYSPQLVTFLDPRVNKNKDIFSIDVDCGARHTGVISGKVG